jgi:hypothetical protein
LSAANEPARLRWDRRRIDPAQSLFHGARQPIAASRQEKSMLDIVMLAFGLAFFVAAVGYTYACERL